MVEWRSGGMEKVVEWRSGLNHPSHPWAVQSTKMYPRPGMKQDEEGGKSGKWQIGDGYLSILEIEACLKKRQKILLEKKLHKGINPPT